MKDGFFRSLWIACLLLSAGIFTAQSVCADVYKFTDKDGIVHYTNIKPPNVKPCIRRYVLLIMGKYGNESPAAKPAIPSQR